MPRPMIPTSIAAGVAVLLLSFVAETSAQTSAASPADQLRSDLQTFKGWLATAANGPAWRTYLEVDHLEGELAHANSADPLALAEILERFAEGGPEADRPPYVDVRRDIERWLGHLPPPPVDRLAAMVQAAKGAFVPRTKADVDLAGKDLSAALERLNVRLNLSGPGAEAWRRYLLTNEIKEQLSRPAGPDLSVLDLAYTRFSSGHNGLDLVWFKDAKDALREYVLTARAVGDPKVRTAYQQVLDALPQHLEAYAKNPTPDEAQAIATVIRYLEEAGQAGWLVNDIRYYYDNPNLFVQVSQPVVEAGIARGVDNLTPITDCILGTSISGRGHTSGRIGVELVPDNDLAHISLLLTGQTQADTVGYNGPVQIFSSSCAAFAARKPVFIDARQLWSGNATANATTNTVIRDIEAQRALVERIAWKRAEQSKGASEQIASQHASQRVAASLEAQSSDLIARAEQRYQTKFRMPLQERRVFPLDLRFQTTPSDLRITAIEADQAQLTSPSGPPQVPADDLLVRIHESAVNNLFEEAVAGMTLHEQDFRDDVPAIPGAGS